MLCCVDQGDDIMKQKAVATDETEVIDCGLVLRSIGYRSVPIDPAVPFDKHAGIVPNNKGRVTDCPGSLLWQCSFQSFVKVVN